MIFYWIQKLLARLRWLVIPVLPRDVAQIDPNAKCPGCGHSSGTIACVHQVVSMSVDPTKPVEKVGVAVFEQHTCGICGARWFERPVTTAKPTELLPDCHEPMVRAA